MWCLSPKRVPRFPPRLPKASRRCHDCGRDFFGDTCYEAHCTKTRDGKTARVHQQSICFTRRRCEECFKLEVGLKDIERHRCGTWIVLPATNTSTLKPIAVTFKELSPLKKSNSKKGNANENVGVNEVPLPNEVLLLASKSCGPMRKEKTMMMMMMRTMTNKTPTPARDL